VGAAWVKTVKSHLPVKGRGGQVVSEFIIEATITGPQATIGEFRSQFLDSFPVIRKDSPGEIILTLSGGDLDPRPTLLSLSCEFPGLTFSVREFQNSEGENMLSDRWQIQDGEVSQLKL
jgi:hypothetical protein